MSKLPLLLLFLAPITIFAQSDTPPVQKMPQYPGGKAALTKLFMDSISPLSVKWEEVSPEEQDGHMVLSLSVNEKGMVEGVKVVTSMGAANDARCVRLARKLKFIPASYNGKPVKASYLLHIDRED